MAACAPFPDPPRGGNAAPPPARAAERHGVVMPWNGGEVESLDRSCDSQSVVWPWLAAGFWFPAACTEPPPPAALAAGVAGRPMGIAAGWYGIAVAGLDWLEPLPGLMGRLREREQAAVAAIRLHDAEPAPGRSGN